MLLALHPFLPNQAKCNSALETLSGEKCGLIQAELINTRVSLLAVSLFPCFVGTYNFLFAFAH